MDSLCSINPIECSEVKKGDHVIIKTRPCKVVNVVHTKTGKHGHVKVNLTGIDVLTSKKFEYMSPGHISMMQFKLIKKEYQLVLIDENSLVCLDESSKEINVVINEEAEIYAKIKVEFNAGKNLLISVIVAPVEMSGDKFVDETIVDNFKEDRTTI